MKGKSLYPLFLIVILLSSLLVSCANTPSQPDAHYTYEFMLKRVGGIDMLPDETKYILSYKLIEQTGSISNFDVSKTVIYAQKDGKTLFKSMASQEGKIVDSGLNNWEEIDNWEVHANQYNGGLSVVPYHGNIVVLIDVCYGPGC